MAEVKISMPNEAPTRPLARMTTDHGAAVIQFFDIPVTSLTSPKGASRVSPCQMRTYTTGGRMRGSNHSARIWLPNRAGMLVLSSASSNPVPTLNSRVSTT